MEKVEWGPRPAVDSEAEADDDDSDDNGNAKTNITNTDLSEVPYVQLSFLITYFHLSY